MKTPQDLNKIYNKLPMDKTELTKVELSIASDLDSSVSKLEKAVAAEKQWNAAVKSNNASTKEIIKQVQKAENERNKLMNSGEKIDQQSIDLHEVANDLLMKADKAAKELGVKPDGIGSYKKVDALMKKIFTVDPVNDFIDNPYF